MEKIALGLEIGKNYIFNNDLNISKELFFTIIIGEITIYGILLTFYQFVESYQKDERTTYLGYDLARYFIDKNMKLCHIIISKKVFCASVVLEILYKPFMTVYGHFFKVEIINAMNFIWFTFVVLYLIVFVVFFFLCAKSTMAMKMVSDANIKMCLIGDINKKFFEKIVKEKIRYSKIDLTRCKFEYLHRAIQYDNNHEWQKEYNKLVYNIFDEYRKQRKNEIANMEKEICTLETEEDWVNTIKNELRLVQDSIDEKYFTLDKENILYILDFHLSLLEVNFKFIQLEKDGKMRFDKQYEMPEKEFDTEKSESIVLRFYEIMDDKRRKDLINRLERNIILAQDLYKEFCNKCIEDLIETEIDWVFKGKEDQKNFVKKFDLILKREEFNNALAEMLLDKIIGHDRFDATVIIEQLNEQNCTYLFTYIVMYYSIYRFQFEWKFFNINVLRKLWDRHGNLRNHAEEVTKRIKRSNIGHRFTEKMYLKFIEYIVSREDGKLYKTIYDEKILDVFYIWVLKTYVINQDRTIYSIYLADFDLETQIAIVNSLSKHDELLKDRTVEKWIQYMRPNIFMDLSEFPSTLSVSFRCLLLTDISAVLVANHLCKIRYYYVDSIGMYMLTKLHELPSKIQNQRGIKESVKRAFIAQNMDVDEYLAMIEKECELCYCKIDYVQKEKMKEYLLRSF